MDTLLIFFLGVLTGLVIGIGIIVAVMSMCNAGKSHDIAFGEYDSGSGYPRHEA
ncbi:hypothetical protein [Paraburkholderia franconis]|uniref:hypothetical protein n=1 Tax=Paraburkholderia franconis TaxID=2654983 RepID=UPI00187B9CF7|nr:hypothetical protein [Paraburkholderia franconis]